MRFEVGERSLMDGRKVSAAHLLQHVIVQRIELQVDLDARLVSRQLRDEFRLARDAQAVGVDHQVTDRAHLGGIENGEEIRVQGRFTAGKLDHVGLGLVGDDGVEHRLDFGQRAVILLLRAGFGIAHRAAQVAMLGDLDHRQAGVLHVVRAQAAIVGAAVQHARIELIGHFRRLDVDLATEAVILGIVGDQHALRAMRRAPFV